MGGEIFCRILESRREIRFFSPEDPVDGPVPAQPRQLALGVLAGAELDLPDGVRRRGGAVADGEKLPVADGLQGGCIARNAA